MRVEQDIDFFSNLKTSIIGSAVDTYVQVISFLKILVLPNLAIGFILLCMGIVGLILFLVLAHYFNKFLTHLTFKYEISTWGVVRNPPKLSKTQIEKLKVLLFWWNKQCDSWYMTSGNCIEKALSGEKINLEDAKRIGDATQAYKWHGFSGGKDKISKKTQNRYDEFRKSILVLEKELQKQANYKKVSDKLLKEDDVLSKQLKIAKYSALAAIASAVATAFLVYLTYLKM